MRGRNNLYFFKTTNYLWQLTEYQAIGEIAQLVHTGLADSRLIRSANGLNTTLPKTADAPAVDVRIAICPD